MAKLRLEVDWQAAFRPRPTCWRWQPNRTAWTRGPAGPAEPNESGRLVQCQLQDQAETVGLQWAILGLPWYRPCAGHHPDRQARADQVWETFRKMTANG